MSNIPLNVNTVNWDITASKVLSRFNQNLTFDASNSLISFQRNSTQFATFDTSFNFTFLPSCSAGPTSSTQLVNKAYVDASGNVGNGTGIYDISYALTPYPSNPLANTSGFGFINAAIRLPQSGIWQINLQLRIYYASTSTGFIRAFLSTTSTNNTTGIQDVNEIVTTGGASRTIMCTERLGYTTGYNNLGWSGSWIVLAGTGITYPYFIYPKTFWFALSGTSAYYLITDTNGYTTVSATRIGAYPFVNSPTSTIPNIAG